MHTTDTNEPGFRYPWKHLAAMTLLFLGLHLLWYWMGIRFDRGSLIEVMHFLDTEALRDSLWQSIFYLHIQPPLMNLVTGLILKVTPEGVWLFQALFLFLGWLLYLAIFLLQRRFGVSAKTAFILSTLFLASPSFILWEHFLLYTLPCAAFLALATLVLFELLERPRPINASLFFCLIFLLCGTRSMFHLGYFLIVLGVLLATMPRARKLMLLSACLPLLLLTAFYAKNLVLFGEFTACTFVEKNLWIMTAGNMRWEEKTQWVEEGKLSPFSLINRWASLDAYPPEFKEVPEAFKDIPVLAETHKKNGAVNYNHYGNIAICNHYGADAKYVLRHQPKAYCLALLASSYRYFKSSSALPVSPQNQACIPALIAFYDHACYGKCPFDLAPCCKLVAIGGHPPYLFLLFGLPLLACYGLYQALFSKTRRREERLILLFILFNIALVAGLGCALDFHETARYRFLTDGLSLVLLGMALESLLQRFCRRDHKETSETSPAPPES